MKRQPRPIKFSMPLFFLSLVGLWLAGTTENSMADEPAHRPNILLILSDDQGWWDLGVHGHPVLKTPHMDALCGQGVEFTQFYVSPVCSLTRASLLTGRHPVRTGCFDTRFGNDSLGLSEITIAQLLKQAGYKTGLFGKWHQGRYMPYHPNHRGFEQFFGFWQYGHVERYFHPDRMWRNQDRVDCRGHITELITDAAIDFIASQDQAPFFCYVAYNVPHEPLQAPIEYVKKYLGHGLPLREAQIAALVEHCDTNIGRLLKSLDDRGQADNTIVLFFSDNGGISKHYNAGLRGHKGNVYEGGILSPLFVRYPNHFPAGAKVQAMSDVVDLLPTLCEATGANPPTDRVIDGRSLLPLLRDGQGESPHQYLPHLWSRGRPSSEKNWAIRDRQYKLVNGELFDLLKDRGEKQNLATEHPEIVSRLRSTFLTWFEDVCAGQSFERARIQVGREDENPVELQTSWAKLHGKDTRYTFDAYDWDFVDGWNQPGDAVEWKLNVVQAGQYRLSMSYACARPDANGQFEAQCGDAKLCGRIEATPNIQTYITREIGELQIPAGEATFRIEAKSLPGSQLMALNRVWLKKIDGP